MNHWTDDQARDLTGHVTTAVERAVARDSVGVATVLADVASRYGNVGLYSMCVGFAHVIRAWAAKASPAGTALVGMAIEVEGCEPEDLPAEARPQLWAARFTAAYVNGDRDTTEALYLAPLHAGRPADSRQNVAALLAMAADLVRSGREEQVTP